MARRRAGASRLMEGQLHLPISAPYFDAPRPKPGLPPLDVRRESFDEISTTPTDSRGLVELDSLVEVVKSSVADDYHWRGEKDIHHLYWSEYTYSNANLFNQNDRRLRHFRELPVHKLKAPREFHNVIHKRTTEVAPPSDEVMEYRIMAYELAKRAFINFSGLVKKQRLAEMRDVTLASGNIRLKDEFGGIDIIGQEIIDETWDRHFRYLEPSHRHLERVPDEFKIVAPEDVEPLFEFSSARNVEAEQLLTAAPVLAMFGRVATKNSIDVDLIEDMRLLRIA